MRLHFDIITSTIAAIAVFVLTFWLFGTHIDKVFDIIFSAILWFLFGTFYYIMFEYAYHRLGLHEWKIIKQLYEGHYYHHCYFQENHMTSRNKKFLRGTVTNWHIFPILFIVHFFIFRLFFDPAYAFSFFAAITINFVFFYQILHWCTHLGDNALDRFIQKTPFWKIRKKQIENHIGSLGHHNNDKVYYNFSPLLIGDWIFKTYK